MSEEKKGKLLSASQRKMLENVRSGRSPYAHVFGSAASGGASGTMMSIIRAGLLKRVVSRYEITKKGIEALRTGRIPSEEPRTAKDLSQRSAKGESK